MQKLAIALIYFRQALTSKYHCEFPIALLYMFDIRWINEIMISDTEVMTDFLMSKPQATRPPIVDVQRNTDINQILNLEIKTHNPSDKSKAYMSLPLDRK